MKPIKKGIIFLAVLFLLAGAVELQPIKCPQHNVYDFCWMEETSTPNHEYESGQ